MGRYVLGVVAATIYCAVDVFLMVMVLYVMSNGVGMIGTILEILYDGAENLLALCPAWTIGTVNELKDLAAVRWGNLALNTMGAATIVFADISFLFSILCSGSCPNTPTVAVHILALYSLFVFGTSLNFAISSMALEWKNNGNPFYGYTDPRDIDSRYYERDCGGYGGCSGSYSRLAVPEHDIWCPSGTSPLLDTANTLQVVGLILFSTTWVILLPGLLFAVIFSKGRIFRLMVVIPAAATALYGLIIGGIQFPLLLPWIFGHALWQYMRLLVNWIAGVSQTDIDKQFRVNPGSDDMVPGIIGAPTGDGDGGGEIDAGGYMGY